MNTIGELLTVPQVAARLGLRESTIRSWVLARRIGRVRVGRRAIRIPLAEVEHLGKYWRFDETELRAWLECQRAGGGHS